MNEHNSRPNGDAERLYSAIGGIDDRYVQEAIEYRAERTKKARVLPFAKTLASLAAALLVVTVAFGVFGRLLSPPAGGDAPPVDGATSLWSVAEGYRENTALIACLSDSREKADASALPPALDSGKITILWRDASDGTYYSVTVDFLSQTQRQRLNGLLKGTAAAEVDPTAEKPPFSLWISMGDGTAVSPYLPMTDGTVSYGTLSDYAPEQLPSEALAAFLGDLIEAELND